MKVVIEISDEKLSQLAEQAIEEHFKKAFKEAVEISLKLSMPSIVTALRGAAGLLPGLLSSTLRAQITPVLQEHLQDLEAEFRRYAQAYFAENATRVLEKMMERMAREALTEQDRAQKGRK